MPNVAIDVYRRLPAALRHELPGVGDEAYRARFGGGVMARRPSRRHGHAPLPAVGASPRDAAARVAAAALAQVPAGRHLRAAGAAPRHVGHRARR